MFWFGLMGSLMLAFLGLMTSIWAEKFDHAAAVTNFVVAPLVAAVGHLLFGRAIVAGVPGGQPCQPVLLRDLGLPLRLPRGGDLPILVGALLLLAINVALWAVCYALLRSGWKIKN